jgi:Fe-S cluster biogenesis protein NfuA
MAEQKDVQRRIESMEGLIREIEKISDPAVRSLSQQLVQSLMDLHGSGIGRMIEIVHGSGENGQQIVDELGRDPLVGGLLLLYGLHPLDLQARILEALEKTRPYLRSHGGDVALVRISESGAVTIRLEGSCHSCPSSAVTLQSTVEQAIYDAAPDVTAILIEGAVQEPASTLGFVPLANLQAVGKANLSAQSPAIADQTALEDVLDVRSAG